MTSLLWRDPPPPPVRQRVSRTRRTHPPMWRDTPITYPEPVQCWPLITRVRLALARWIAGL